MMAGLLGESFDDPRTAAVFQAAQGLLGGGSNAQRFAGAGASYAQMMQVERARKLLEERERQMMAAREQEMQMRAEAQKRAQAEAARQQAIDAAYSGAIRSPQQQAMQQFGGPTQAAATAAPGMQPQIDQNALIQGLMKADPRAAYQMLQPQPDDLVSLAPGATMYSKRDKKRVFTAAPAPEKDDADIRLLKMLHGEGTPAFMAALQKLEQKRTTHAPAASATVVLPQQEKKEQEAVGKYFGEQYATIQTSGLAAGNTINRLAQMRTMLEGMKTGKLAPLAADVAAFSQSFGINIDPNLGDKQAVDAMSKEMALQMRNPSGGAGMPGALSDKDREFLERIVPGLAKTPEGNAKIIEARMKLAQRDQVVAKMARDYRKRTGTLDEGFYEELQAYSDANPLFSDMAAPARDPAALFRDADAIIGGK